MKIFPKESVGEFLKIVFKGIYRKITEEIYAMVSFLKEALKKLLVKSHKEFLKELLNQPMEVTLK